MVRFRIRFAVESGREDEFLTLIQDSYRSALARQKGYLGSRLLKSYDAETLRVLEARDDGFGYELEFEFQSEQERLVWVAGSDHDTLWEAAVSLTQKRSWCGYEVLGNGGPHRTKEPGVIEGTGQ